MPDVSWSMIRWAIANTILFMCIVWLCAILQAPLWLYASAAVAVAASQLYIYTTGRSVGQGERVFTAGMIGGIAFLVVCVVLHAITSAYAHNDWREPVANSAVIIIPALLCIVWSMCCASRMTYSLRRLEVVAITQCVLFFSLPFGILLVGDAW